MDEIDRSSWMMRRDVLRLVYESKSGHLASSLGLAEFFSTMYLGGVMRYDSMNPLWEGRDRLIVSNGHVVPIWYTALAYSGFFPRENLLNYAEFSSMLQGHPHVHFEYKSEGVNKVGFPGIESNSGSLGQGVSYSVGVAMGIRAKKRSLGSKYGRVPHTYCLMSDAELQEGQTWEALQLSVVEKLEDLTFVIDRNNIQIDALVDELSPIEPLESKLESFGLHTIEINGHDPEEIERGISSAKSVSGRPTVIVMHTVSGKGVSFMEGDYKWHDHIPTSEEYRMALLEIEERL